jgi:hypothetical protein
VTIYRTLAHLLGTTEAAVKRAVKVRYTKVAEYQARGAVHFHAVVRLDAAPPRDGPEQVAPPPPAFTAELLAEAVRLAAATVAVPYPPVLEGPVRLARWGEQLDVRNISADGTDLSAEAVAGLDGRIYHADELDHLKVSEHVARLVRVCWQLGAHPALAAYRLQAWAHALGSRATGRPAAAATPPPSPRCAAPASPTPSAGSCAAASRWTPGAAAPRRRRWWCSAAGSSRAAATATNHSAFMAVTTAARTLEFPDAA